MSRAGAAKVTTRLCLCLFSAAYRFDAEPAGCCPPASQQGDAGVRIDVAAPAVGVAYQIVQGGEGHDGSILSMFYTSSCDHSQAGQCKEPAHGRKKWRWQTLSAMF